MAYFVRNFTVPGINITFHNTLFLNTDPQILRDLVTKKMPFGKYKDSLMADLPIHYLEWFKRQGFPPGKLGVWMETVYEIRLNGLEEILYQLKRKMK